MFLEAPLSPTATARATGRLRAEFADGLSTTLHYATYARATTRVRVVSLAPPSRLLEWCRANRVPDAIVGGFYRRPDNIPLGELTIDGNKVHSVPFDQPWDRLRACVEINGDGPAILPRPPRRSSGDLLQAGPMLVREGRNVLELHGDVEGFGPGSRQFDSDITVGRYPRAALGLSDDRLIAVACDGRATAESGMTLAELGDAMLALGARDAINLDGGGSTSLVAGYSLKNVPREEHGLELLGGRAVSTALVFESITPAVA